MWGVVRGIFFFDCSLLSTFPLLRYHVLGPTFTWVAFFKDMDTDDDGQFDVNEFITAIVKVYHDELLNEDGSTHMAAGGGDAQGEVADTLAVDTVSGRNVSIDIL